MALEPELGSVKVTRTRGSARGSARKAPAVKADRAGWSRTRASSVYSVRRKPLPAPLLVAVDVSTLAMPRASSLPSSGASCAGNSAAGDRYSAATGGTAGAAMATVIVPAITLLIKDLRIATRWAGRSRLSSSIGNHAKFAC